MKVALCFLISYNHSLNKEHIWRDWIEANKDIIHVYVHCKDSSLIKSEWLREKAMPKQFMMPTDYFHVVPAYFSCMIYGLQQDIENQWFCFLTESCMPIISPAKFRALFLENYATSIMRWKRAWWNPYLHKRANLHRIPPEYHLGNVPWFVLCRQDAEHCISFSQKNGVLYRFICQGIIANESIFAIIFYLNKRLMHIKNEDTTITDWSRMTSSTSPYVFKNGDQQQVEKDRIFIENALKENKYSMFLRKVDADFPFKPSRSD
jgi:Core-2/I-Branching enzyme